ncbi:MAG: bifunctional glycosyltransferase family 2/GtrA family protein [Bryobacterales bacterium]|nr:bifunctional glycosyltransferase family 2/GtrA family protein [Bryobacterales bacterium]
MNSLVLLIPAYQPGPDLPRLVREILHETEGVIDRAVIVNDGSDAKCQPIFDALRAMERVEVIAHAVNLGKGAALRFGFNHILTEDAAVTGIVTADADGQHLPKDIAQTARAHASHPDALVLGVRAFLGAVPFRSRLGNLLTRTVFRLVTGLALRDTQTGLRVWPRAQCLEALRLPFNGYEFEFEHLVRASRAVIREVPIDTVYQPGNPTSHFNPIRDSVRIYFVFLRYSASAVLAAVLDSTVFSIAMLRTGDLLTSQIAGRALATLVAFFVLRHIVFRSTEQAWKSLVRFLLLVAVSGAVSLRLIEALVDGGVAPLSAKLLSEGTLFVANFAVQRTLIFRRE